MKERSIHWRSIHWLSALVATGGMLAAFAEPATAGDPSRSGVSKHHRAEPRLDAIERLGQKIFFDTDLSINENQSCAACHLREVGWTGPDPEINLGGAVYEGSIHGRFGNRKPPTSAYATYAPLFAWDAAEALFVGGNFWDGRATGWQLGNPAADQAQGPFLNPVEQALPNPASVLARVCASEYAQLFRRVWGASACRNVERGYGAIARSVAAYEGSRAVSEFTSKYDAVLAGRARFTEREALGLELFQGKALCANCHTDVAASGAPRALFTDFTYDNIGTPRNPANPFYEMDDVFVDGVPLNPDGADWVDPGLGGFVASLAESDAWRDEPYVTEPLRSMTS